MEKRFINFLLVSMIILVGYSFIMQAMFGERPKPNRGKPGEDGVVQLAEDEGQNELAEENLALAPELNAAADEPVSEDESPASEDALQEDAVAQVEDPAGPQFERKFPLGSIDPDSPFQLLAVFSNRGATIESVELSSPRYLELNRDFGYIGELALEDDGGTGCRIHVVGAGTPAASASAPGVNGGLRGPEFKNENEEPTPGDLVTQLGDVEVRSLADFEAALRKTKPGEETSITIVRSEPSGSTREIEFTLVPRQAPLSVLRVEPKVPSETQPSHPASFLMTLNQIGPSKARFREDEIKGLPSLHDAIWESKTLKASEDVGPGVEFRTRLSQSALSKLELTGPIELVKTYRLTPVDEAAKASQAAEGYRITLDVKVINLGNKDQKIAYQIDGPTGITTEGWWYSYKTHPTRFVAAGARDVAWREEDGGHQLFVNSQISKSSKEDEDSPDVPMTDSEESVLMRYAGCDTQYFAAVLMPRAEADASRPTVTDEFESAFARAVGPLDDKHKRTDVTFRLKSRLFNVGVGEENALHRSYDIFVGPKQSEVLENFGLSDFVVFGWFGWVSKPMLFVLHRLYWLTGKWSYGLAIILLTIMVRSLLFPLGRKMARNAQKMQELAPEMKRIADKYKNDMEKRAAAQKELFAKHGYNPLSGCLVIFIQTPVFLGLYRGLSCDIELRQAPLIPGMSWCSNLAGPDMFWHWDGIVPDFFTQPYGIFGLGPYLNILPVAAVGLMVAQQKLFTPPPQDEQQQMQHTIMKFMMVFMGFIFHKVAAGLCLYIIVSTMWGLGERLLLPKPDIKAVQTSAEPALASAGSSRSSNNGNSKSNRRKKNKKK